MRISFPVGYPGTVAVTVPGCQGFSVDACCDRADGHVPRVQVAARLVLGLRVDSSGLGGNEILLFVRVECPETGVVVVARRVERDELVKRERDREPSGEHHEVNLVACFHAAILSSVQSSQKHIVHSAGATKSFHATETNCPQSWQRCLPATTFFHSGLCVMRVQ